MRLITLAGAMLLSVLPMSSSLDAAEALSHPNDLAAQEYEGAKRFRDIFRDVSAKYGKSEAQVLDTLFLPPPASFQTPLQALEARNPRVAMQALTLKGRQISASSQYQYGRKIPFGARGASDTIFATEGPATIILIPGMMQEVLDDDMFSEITEKPSAFRDRYHSFLHGARDQAYDWEAMRTKEISLSSTVTLGSIDDAEGRPLVQLIVLRSAFGSLETIGPLTRSSDTYLRRINKILELLPSEAYRKVYLMGFSRGTAIGLDILAKMQREGAHPKLSSLQGLITLGGVVYGSDLADYPNRPFKVGLPEFTSPPDPIFLMEQAYKLVSVLIKNAWDPLSNIKRLAVLADDVNFAAEELQTQARLNWWMQNEVPADVAIYSINGSMPVRAMAPWAHMDAPFFGIGDLDYGALRIMARKLQQITGNYLNDGQILDVKGRLWPGLAESINPRQEPLKTQNLGNVATHHFGLGTRNCFKSLGGSINGFPRSIMIEAVAAFVLEQP